MMFSNLHRRYNVRELFMDSTSIVRSLICKLNDVLVVGLTSFYYRSNARFAPFSSGSVARRGSKVGWKADGVDRNGCTMYAHLGGDGLPDRSSRLRNDERPLLLQTKVPKLVRSRYRLERT